jgi:hypothetical protein
MAQRLDVDDNLAIANEEVNGVLQPTDRHRLTARRLLCGDDDVVAFHTQDPICSSPGQRFDFCADERLKM